MALESIRVLAIVACSTDHEESPKNIDEGDGETNGENADPGDNEVLESQGEAVASAATPLSDDFILAGRWCPDMS